MAEHLRIPLPKFLALLTSHDVPVQKAITISGKIYKDHNTPAQLAGLNEVKLVAAGVDNKEDRKVVMKAMRDSGYVPKDLRRKMSASGPDDSSVAGPSKLSDNVQITTPKKGKRKRDDDINNLLPSEPADDEGAIYHGLDFGEILDEEACDPQVKSTVVNRAPMMTAWATIVAERMGFQREEALSIASVYTEMNAVAKGVSLDIFKRGEQRGMEAVKGGSQPYVELMGRRPLYRTQAEQWRALSNGSPVKPSTAFSYISRAFRQTTPHIIGALRLLAHSFAIQELNSVAWALYAEFRPAVDQWGKRSEVKCSTILNLRKVDSKPQFTTSAEDIVKGGDTDKDDINPSINLYTPWKRMKTLSLEEYEVALDKDFAYDNVDLDFEK